MKRREFIQNTTMAGSIALLPSVASRIGNVSASAVQGTQPAPLEGGRNRPKTADIYAAYIHGARFDDLPSDVREKAKDLILDSVGCALGATQTREGQETISLAKFLLGKPESTVIGGGVRVSQEKCALVNTQLANLLDFDDTWDVYSPGHPGCVTIPPALAVGEAVHASGRDLLTAIVLGYEIDMRIGHALGSILWLTGFSLITELAAPAVVTAKLLGMDAGAIERTFGVLTADAGALRLTQAKYDVPPDMDIGTIKGNYGQYSELGVLAAYKARSGLTSMKGLLDVDLTGWYLAGLSAAGFDDLVRGLGHQYWILNMSFKPTPSCRWTHVPITAAWAALGNRPVRASDVDRIVVKGVTRLERYQWDEMTQAQFSIPCALALAISGATPGPGWYSSGRFTDPEIRALASKVKLEREPEAESREIWDLGMTCTVEITFKNGEIKSGRCEHVKGAPQNPMTRNELVSKFKVNASHLKPSRQQELVDKILRFEEIGDVADLMTLLCEAKR
jgi:2-methylcitrate dehydratase PrpD